MRDGAQKAVGQKISYIRQFCGRYIPTLWRPQARLPNNEAIGMYTTVRPRSYLCRTQNIALEVPISQLNGSISKSFSLVIAIGLFNSDSGHKPELQPHPQLNPRPLCPAADLS